MSSPGNIDGPGVEARFQAPNGLARDAAGNLYVADTGNRALRKISPGGEVITMRVPAVGVGAIAIDHAGNIFLGEARRIRKVSVAGDVTTLPVSLRCAPLGMAVDANDNIIMSHCTTILMLTSDGRLLTIAGSDNVQGWDDGPVATATFFEPTGVAVNADGTIYVAEPRIHTVRQISPAGVVSTLAGSPGAQGGQDGAGAAARFDGPSGLALDGEGNVYSADLSGLARKITPSGVVTTMTSGPVYGGRTGIVVDDAGAAYVADTSFVRSAIVKIAADGVATVFAGPEAGYFRGSGPDALAFGNASDLLMLSASAAELGGNSFLPGKLHRVTAAGEASVVLDEVRDTGIRSLAVDAAHNVYVGRSTILPPPVPLGHWREEGGELLRITPTDDTTTLWSSTTVTPRTIAIDPAGVIHVGEGRSSTRVFRISPSGQQLDQASLIPDGAIGSGIAAMLIDGGGDLVVASREKSFHRVNTAGKLSDLFAPTTAQSIAGSIGNISGMAMDRGGNLYVADDARHLIHRITADGAIENLAGALGLVGIRLGPLPGSLYQPRGLAIGPDGDLYVGSAGAVLRIDLAQ